MTVAAETPINTYTANGSTTVFAYTFRIEDASEIKIYHDEVEQTSGFSVSGVGSNGGGSITYTTAPSSGTVVLFLRAMPSTRTIDYQNSGDFRADTVNEDIDRVWLKLQEIERELNYRTLQFLETESRTTSLNRLPSPSANQALVWQADGSIGNSSLDIVVNTSGTVQSVATYALLRSLSPDDLANNQVLYLTTDGISGKGYVRKVSSHGLTDNGGTIIAIDSDTYWQRHIEGFTISSWFELAGDGTDDSTKIQTFLNLGGRLLVKDGNYTCDSQVNITVNGTKLYFESRSAKFIYGSSSTANLLSIQATDVEIYNGTLDGNGNDVGVGSATEDGSLVSAIAASTFKIKNTLFTDVQGDNSIRTKQALLNISNDRVVFDIIDCDFTSCYILDSGGASQDAKFIAFKGNSVTSPTRGVISGGYMSGVGTTLTSGVTADKDGKCIRGFYDESTSGELEFDIEIKGVKATEFDEAFVKMTGMRGMNIHDNHLIGVFTNPWDSVVNRSQYAIRSALNDSTKGSSVHVHDNQIRGKFFRLFEIQHNGTIQNNDVEVDNNSSSEYLEAIYEVTGNNIKVSNNRYKLNTLRRIFLSNDNVDNLDIGSESYTFTLDGDENASVLGRQLWFAGGDITNSKLHNLEITITTTGSPTVNTNLLFMNGQNSDGDITDLTFEDIKIKTDYMLNYLPNNTDNAATIDGVKYKNFTVEYTGSITLVNQPVFTSKTTNPNRFSFEDFTLIFNGIASSVTTSPFALDECDNTQIKNMRIEDINPGANTVGFVVRVRGASGEVNQKLDIDGLTICNIDTSQSRVVDIDYSDIVRVENVSFVECISTAGTKSGIQFRNCNDVVVGNASGNDSALTSWASFIDIDSGDNYLVGTVNCRGTKVTFGSATNTVDNS